MKRDSDWETILGAGIVIAATCVLCGYLIVTAPLEWWPS